MMAGHTGHNSLLLITLSLSGSILAGNWSIHLPAGPICAVSGSSVLLPCSFDFPRSSNETRAEGQPSTQVKFTASPNYSILTDGGVKYEEYKVLSEMWCLEDGRCVAPWYVFHSGGIFPDPSYQNRVQYPKQPKTKNCSLSISDLRPSDSGNYIFYLITSHPTQKMPEQKGLPLLVTDSPSAVVASASPSSGVTEGSALRLACCSPSADPKARYRWFKSGGATHRYDGQVWEISNVASDDTGGYYCQMRTADGEQNSTLVNVNVEYPPRNTLVSVSPPGEFQMSLPVTLTCSSDANPPVHTFSWYQGMACLPEVDKSFYQARESSAGPVSEGSTLNSATISVEEYGQHCCVAHNRHGSLSFSLTLAGIKVAPPPKTTGRRVLLIGVCIGVLLAIIAVIACLLRRRKRSTRHQSYALTATSPTEA